MSEMKQVIVVRSDLKMGKGKLAAQVAHASLAAAEETEERRPSWYSEWRGGGQAKVVLRAASEEELRELMRKARSAGLAAELIEDRGLTQLDPGTVTCLGIGPGPSNEIDRVTGTLRLL